MQGSTAPGISAEKAQQLLRDTGARVTRPRVRVLDFLLAKNAPLTHHEILEQLPGDAFDAVTLYRVLEWLTDRAIVHRIAGADQVWRFSASAAGETGNTRHEHAHFQCTRCEEVTCFTDVPLPRTIKLPSGFQSQEMDFLIKGTCPHCAKSKP